MSIELLAWEKSRVLVLTDIASKPDEEESLLRFLVDLNEFDLENLIATLTLAATS